MMRHLTVLRLLLAGFLLYIAWPYIPMAVTNMGKIFWSMWIGLFLLAVGGNVATFLRMTEPPSMEHRKERERQRS